MLVRSLLMSTFLFCSILISVNSCNSEATQNQTVCTKQADCPSGLNCNANGQCVIDSLPADMSASGGHDMSLDQMAPSQTTLTYSWAKRYGSTQNENAWSMAVDSKGNSWIAGRFQGPMDFGGTVLQKSPYSWFLAKFSGTGQLLWVRDIGSFVLNPNVRNNPPVLAIDSADNVYFSGMFFVSGGKVDCGNGVALGPGATRTDLIIVCKFDSSGNNTWSTSIGAGPSADFITSMAVDSVGELIVTGTTVDAFSFGKTPLPIVGGTDIYLAKLHATDGSEVWAKRFGAAGIDLGASVAIAPGDDIVLSGSFSAGVDFGGGLLANRGGRDVFVARYTKDGQHVWSKSFGSGADDDGRTVTVAPNGAIAVGGSHGATVSSITGASNCGLNYVGSTDAFVVALNAAGTCSWARGFGSAQADSTEFVGWDSAQNLISTGTYAGNIDFGLGIQIPFAKDVFAVRLLPMNGQTMLARGYGGSGDDGVYMMRLGSQGDVYLCGGSSSDVLDFGGGPLNTGGTGTEDIYVVKFSGM